MKTEKLHDRLLKTTDLKPGDKVKLIGTCESDALGWNNSWQNHMSRNTGRIGTVTGKPNSAGVLVQFPEESEFNCYAYPLFLLEKVESPKPPITNIGGHLVKYNPVSHSLTIGCTTVLANTVHSLSQFLKEQEQS